jgi:hypothetical protein
MNNITARMNYENAQAALVKAFGRTPGFNVSNFKITQSYLRMEALLVAGVTTYSFFPLINQSPINNTEQRLNLQDSFVISQIGMFLGAAASATDSTFVLQTYPDPLIFTTGAATLNGIYSGQLKISVNNDVLLTAWDITRHYNVNQTQTSVAAATPPPNAQVGQTKLAEDGLYAMEPNIILVGSKNNQIQVTLPTGLGAIGSNYRLVLFLRGHLIQNSTVVS